jgi:hypothetical protein
MAGVVDKLVARVLANMAVRTVGVTSQMVKDTISDVLDGLVAVKWDGEGAAEKVQEAWESLAV